MRIAVISHALVIPSFRKRWIRLARETDHEIFLIVPKTWIQTWFSEKVVYHVEEEHSGNFHVIPQPTTSRSRWTRYFFLSIDAGLHQIRPDLIYVIHEETILVHNQIRFYRRLWARKASVIFFSMRALGVKRDKWYDRATWNAVKSYTDAAICHYPGCVESLQSGSYSKPIFMQTQVGVDDEIFTPDKKQRKDMRDHLGLSDRFVIGFCGRLTADKGVDDLLSILPLDDVNWALLLIGNGPMYEDIVQLAKERGWQDRIVITRFVQQHDVPDYMRAMDCLVLGSKTRPYWIDTFPLVTVQAMCSGVPVIGARSGAIPWQIIDGTGLLFPEGDAEMLREHIRWIASNPDKAASMAERGREWALANFSVTAINEGFDHIVRSIKSGNVMHKSTPEDLYVQHKAV